MSREMVDVVYFTRISPVSGFFTTIKAILSIRKKTEGVIIFVFNLKIYLRF
jgi:hypothetical protein